MIDFDSSFPGEITVVAQGRGDFVSSEAQVHFTDLQISFGKLIGLVGHHFVSVVLGICVVWKSLVVYTHVGIPRICHGT